MADPAWPAQTSTASRTEAWARGLTSGHAHRPSLTTNASGIPDSIISYTSTAEVHAHEFPRPPSTIPSSPVTPTTPRSMAYSQHSQTPYSPLTPYHPGGSAPSQPLMPRRPSVLSSSSPPAYSTSPLSSEYSSATEKSPRPSANSTPRHSFGPRALPNRPLTRHASSSRMVPMPPALPEGEVVNHTVADYPISTISFDSRAPADHSDTRTLSSDILSTSFITDLISSTSPKQNPQQEDDSIISAITYPPVQTYIPLPSRDEARAPPSAFAGYHNLDNASSNDHSGMVPIGLHGSGHNRDSYQSSAADMSLAARSVSSRTPLRNDIQPDRASVAPFEQPEQYLPQPNRRRKSVSRYPEARQSMHSTRSQTGSVISRISSSVRAQWRRIKPLPPVPTLPHVSVAQAQQHRQIEETMPLPALAGRSRELAHMLEKGYQPHQSVYDLGDAEQAILQAQARKAAATSNPNQAEEYTRTVEYSYTHPGGITGVLPKEELEKAASKKKKSGGSKLFQGNMRIVILASFGVVVVAVIAAAVAAVVLTKHKQKACASGLAGAQCNLASTCACTGSASSGANCQPLSQNLVDLVPSMNSFFNTNLSTSAVALSLWEAQGDIGTTDCSKQAVLVDIAPAAPTAGVQSNWTQWTQAALLWTTVQSQNLTGVSNLRKFVTSADWSSAASGPSDKFKTAALGYQYDFLGQTIVEPPQSFTSVGKADSSQQARVDDGATGTLDRMYSHAVAASAQQGMSLKNYWTATLQQNVADLPKFLSAVQSSSITLPFDGTSPTINGQLTNSTTTPFPPPLACYPSLNADIMSRVNTIETSVFGLPSASSPSNLQTSCYADRPIYGVLNVLRLRWPFLRNGTALQSVVLKSEASPRAVVYSGEALSALPTAKDAPPASSYSTDPRQYGTITNMNHVLLRWFVAIGDVGVANALVKFVLSSSTVPPTPDSLVYQKLMSIPKLEVAVFGSVLPGDVDSVNSGLNTPTNGWYFGSPQALALRQWTINAAQAEVVWAPNATSPSVVRDNALPGSANFLKVWQPSQQSYAAGNLFDATSMSLLTQSFIALQLFSR